MKTIFLIQHTESEHHVNHHIGAQYEWNLTARGRVQSGRACVLRGGGLSDISAIYGNVRLTGREGGVM